MKFYEKIKMLRNKKGLSQQELADLIGIHTTHMNRLENGHYNPSFEVFKKLVEIFEVSADYLISDDSDDYKVNLKDRSLLEKARLLDSLEEEEKDGLMKVIDSMLTKKKLLDLLTTATEAAKEGKMELLASGKKK